MAIFDYFLNSYNPLVEPEEDDIIKKKIEDYWKQRKLSVPNSPEIIDEKNIIPQQITGVNNERLFVNPDETDVNKERLQLNPYTEIINQAYPGISSQLTDIDKSLKDFSFSSTLKDINELRNKESALYNTPLVDNDKGFKRKLFSVFREALINAANAYNSEQGPPEQKLLAALGGLGGGAVSGALDKYADERRQRLFDIAVTRDLANQKFGEFQKNVAIQNTLSQTRNAVLEPIRRQAELENQKLDLELKKESIKAQEKESQYKTLTKLMELLSPEWVVTRLGNGEFVLSNKNTGQTLINRGDTIKPEDITNTSYLNIPTSAGELKTFSEQKAAKDLIPEFIKSMSTDPNTKGRIPFSEKFLQILRDYSNSTSDVSRKYFDENGNVDYGKVSTDLITGAIKVPPDVDIFDKNALDQGSKRKLDELTANYFENYNKVVARYKQLMGIASTFLKSQDLEKLKIKAAQLITADKFDDFNALYKAIEEEANKIQKNKK